MDKIYLMRACLVLFLAVLPLVGFRLIGVDGESSPALYPSRKFVVDSSGNVGEHSSLALDVNGNPRISYYDSSSGDLKYARWTGTEWAVEFVDTQGNVGLGTSIALEASGNPWISYFDVTNGDLKVAKFTGSWNLETVDSNGVVGQYSSIALDSGNPAISYYDSSSRTLKYARWSGGIWTTETVDSRINSGLGSSLAFDSAGLPHISYVLGEPNYDLIHARHDGNGWIIETVDSSANTLGNHTSIGLYPGGKVAISYYDSSFGDLKSYDSTGPTIETVDSLNDVGEFSSLALDSLGNIHVAYFDRTDYDLKYAIKTGSAWVIERLDTGGHVGLYPSIAMSGDSPRVTYQDADDFDLKFALPEISVNYRIDPFTGTAPLQFDFGAEASGGKPPYTYLWTFGDGTTSNLQVASHTYVAPGDYTVTLTVTDEFGPSGVLAQHIRVRSDGGNLQQVLSLIVTGGVGAAVGALLTFLFLRRRKREVSSDQGSLVKR